MKRVLNTRCSTYIVIHVCFFEHLQICTRNLPAAFHQLVHVSLPDGNTTSYSYFSPIILVMNWSTIVISYVFQKSLVNVLLSLSKEIYFLLGEFYLLYEEIPSQCGHCPKVGVLKQHVHDPHDLAPHRALRVDSCHQYRDICSGLVVCQQNGLLLIKTAYIIASLHDYIRKSPDFAMFLNYFLSISTQRQQIT